ncbi:MAG: hypothetical protein ACI83H_002800, partial [Glaciecola sp.]
DYSDSKGSSLGCQSKVHSFGKMEDYLNGASLFVY